MQNYLVKYDVEKSSRHWRRLPLAGRYRRLPIFFQDQGDQRIYYSPGFVGVAKRNTINSFERSITSTEISPVGEIPALLLKHALQAMRKIEEFLSQPFVPVCLTLYLSNQCNLNCSYCFSDSQESKSEILDINHVETALKTVIQNCKNTNHPLMLVFHGGGEPTINIRLIDEIIALANQLSEIEGLDPFYYIATNGVLSIKNAQWLASHFHKIGLSCDGPDFIQDKQRPRLNRSGSSRFVERTAAIIRDSGSRFTVRVTLTPEYFLYQEEIADYICRILKPDEIHVEPLYDGGRARGSMNFTSSHISLFIEHYLKARHVAQEQGIPWLSSGSRPEEIHGPYCNTLRSVLNLIPGGIATACFKTSTSEDAFFKNLVVGCVDDTKNNSQFNIDQNHIRELNRNILASSIPTRCADCFNQYHCVQGCPDCCHLDEKGGPPENDFRCSFQKALATHIIFETIKKMSDQSRLDQDAIGGIVTSKDQTQ